MLPTSGVRENVVCARGYRRRRRTAIVPCVDHHGKLCFRKCPRDIRVARRVSAGGVYFEENSAGVILSILQIVEKFAVVRSSARRNRKRRLLPKEGAPYFDVGYFVSVDAGFFALFHERRERAAPCVGVASAAFARDFGGVAVAQFQKRRRQDVPRTERILQKFFTVH